MSEIQYNLPDEIRADQDSDHGEYRPGMTVTKGASGYSLTRIWSEMNLRRYGLDPTMIEQSGDGLKNLKAFNRQTELGTSGFWLKEQVDGDHLVAPCGPLGDASRTCFPLPIYGSASDVVVMIDGVPKDSGDYTIHEAANLLPDTTANPTAASTFVQNGAEADQGNFGLVGPSCVKVTPDTVGACLLYVPGPSTNGAAVTVGDDYTAILAVFESKASPRTFTPQIRWYDSGPGFLSATSGSAVAATYGEWTVYSVTGTAPASAAWCIPAISEPGATADSWFSDAFAIAPANYDRWHLPTFAPNVIEFSSAPALNQRVTTSASGRGMAWCKMKQDSMSWSMISPGHATPNKLSASEEVEI